MLTLQRFKITTIFVALVVLLIGTVGAYAHHYKVKQGYIQLEPSVGESNPGSVYWNISLGEVYLSNSAKKSHSGHSYAVENYSKFEISVVWEFKHEVFSIDDEGNASSYEDATTFDTVVLGKEGSRGKSSDSYGRAKLSVTDIAPGLYDLDTYTSVDINYENKRPKIDKKITYQKEPKLIEDYRIK